MIEEKKKIPAGKILRDALTSGMDFVDGKAAAPIMAPTMELPARSASAAADGRNSAAQSRVSTLFFSDVAGSTSMKRRLPAEESRKLLDRHVALFRQCLETTGGRLLENPGDSLYAEFATPSEAVRAALLFQWLLHAEPWNPEPVRVRIGLHLGEVLTQLDAASGLEKPYGPAVDVAARVMSLAGAGQILMTRAVFGEARQFLREHPLPPEKAGAAAPPGLKFLAHGRYRFKGDRVDEGEDEPLEVCEAGGEGIAPLAAPPDSEKAWRHLDAEEAETLGWRPGVGQEVPGRPGWILEKRLGEGGFGEAWLGRHSRLREERVFKFCFDTERLRSFKREEKLFVLLKLALGDRPDIAAILETQQRERPYFIESRYYPEGNLLQWAEKCGGLEAVPLEDRLALAAQTARVVGAAHAAGIIHKDLKPSNILIRTDTDGRPHAVLADFGIGTLTDVSVLEQMGFSQGGFSAALLTANRSSRSGTRLYTAPEYLTGRPASILGDVYALGVMLYQLVVGDATRALAPGWESDVSDEFLREDIAAAVHGKLELRLQSAEALAVRLENLEQRRAQRAAAQEIELRNQKAREAAAREAQSRAQMRRFRRLAFGFGALGMVALASAWFGWEKQRTAVAQRDRAEENQRQLAEQTRALTKQIAYASRSDQSLAEKMGTAGNWRDSVSHLARSLEFDPKNAAAARHLWTALAYGKGKRPALPLHEIKHPLRAPRYSASGRFLVGLQDGALEIIGDTGDGRTYRPKPGIKLFKCDPAADRALVVFSDHAAALVDLETAGSLAEFPPPAGRAAWTPHSILFSPDSHLAAILSRQEKANSDPDANDAAKVFLADLAGKKWREGGIEIGYRVHALAFVTDGLLATGGEDANGGAIQFWDVATLKPDGPALRQGRTVGELDRSPDGTLLLAAALETDASNAGANAQLWNVQERSAVGKPMWDQMGIHFASFSPDGTRIATSHANPSGLAYTLLWDAQTQQKISGKLEHPGPGFRNLLHAEFSADGRLFGSASIDGTVMVWHCDSGTPAFPPLRSEAAGRFAFHPTRPLLAMTGRTTQVWGLAPPSSIGWSVAAEDPYGTDVPPIAFSPDGQRCVRLAEDRSLLLADFPDLSQHQHRIPSTKGSTTFEVSPAGGLVGSIGADKRVRLHRITDGSPVGGPLGQTDAAVEIQFSPDGNRLAILAGKRRLAVWSLAKEPVLLAEWDQAGDAPEYAAALRFSPDGRHLLTLVDPDDSNGYLPVVWKLDPAPPVAVFRRDSIRLYRLPSFTPDGTGFLAFNENQMITVSAADWGVSHREAEDLDKFLLVSPDGDHAVSAWRNTGVRLWPLAAGREPLPVLQYEGQANYFNFGWSADSRTFGVGRDDGTVRLGSVPGGGFCSTVLDTGRNDQPDISFAPQGDWVVGATSRGGPVLWRCPDFADAVPPALLKLAQAATGQYFAENGELKELSAEERLTLGRSLQAEPFPPGDATGMLVDWFFAQPDERPVVPGAPVTQAMWARQAVIKRRDAVTAHLLASGVSNPNILLVAAGREEKSPRRAAFLRNLAQRRLPPDAGSWAAAARMLFLQEEPAAALTCAEKAVELDAQLPEAVYMAFVSGVASGKTPTAIRFAKALLQNAAAGEKESGEAALFIASCGLRKEFEAAVENSAVRFTPNGRFAVSAARGWLALGEPEKALDLISSISANAPLDMPGHHEKTSCKILALWRLERKDEAAAAYKRATGGRYDKANDPANLSIYLPEDWPVHMPWTAEESAVLQAVRAAAFPKP